MKTDIDLFKALKCFTAAIERGSFSAAARQLGLTPAAVSKQIAHLETRLGVRLFQRTTRQLSPTEEGRRLHALTLGPAQEIEDALQSVTGKDAKVEGIVRVSLPLVFTRFALLPYLPEFMRQYPDVLLDLRFENRQVDLIAENYDCAIGVLSEQDSNVVARALLPFTKILCASAEYIAARDEPLYLEQLSAHDLIFLRSDTSGRIQPWHLVPESLVRPSLKPSIIMTDMQAITEATLAGCGISLLGIHHAVPYLKSGRLKRVLGKYSSPSVQISIYYPARKLLAPRVRAFVDFAIWAANRGGIGEQIDAAMQVAQPPQRQIESLEEYKS